MRRSDLCYLGCVGHSPIARPVVGEAVRSRYVLRLSVAYRVALPQRHLEVEPRLIRFSVRPYDGYFWYRKGQGPYAAGEILCRTPEHVAPYVMNVFVRPPFQVGGQRLGRVYLPPVHGLRGRQVPRRHFLREVPGMAPGLLAFALDVNLERRLGALDALDQPAPV